MTRDLGNPPLVEFSASSESISSTDLREVSSRDTASKSPLASRTCRTKLLIWIEILEMVVTRAKQVAVIERGSMLSSTLAGGAIHSVTSVFWSSQGTLIVEAGCLRNLSHPEGTTFHFCSWAHVDGALHLIKVLPSRLQIDSAIETPRIPQKVHLLC